MDGENIIEQLISEIDVGIEESEKVLVSSVIPEALHCSSESDIAQNLLGFICAKLCLPPVHFAFFPVLIKLVPVFELGHGLTPVEVLLMEMSRDLNPFIQLLLNCSVHPV